MKLTDEEMDDLINRRIQGHRERRYFEAAFLFCWLILAAVYAYYVFFPGKG